MSEKKTKLKWLVTDKLERGVRRKTNLSYGKDWGGWYVKGWEEKASKISERYGKQGIKCWCYWDDDFPESLRSIADPPVAIYYRGDLPKNDEVWLAVIGSRKMSSRGKVWVRRIMPELVKERIGIVSGLALGVDGEVHKECVRVGGKTVAVLPTSLDKIYPARHRQLAEKILATGGGLMSEYPLGSELRKSNFLERNRLVAGLSRGVVVIEAARKSGSINTPNWAVEQGKDVWCVEKKPEEENSEGLLDLVVDGARVIKSGGEIVKEIKLN